MTQKMYLCLTLCLVAYVGVAQTNNGPGGVGNTAGNSALSLWLKPESGVVYDAGLKVSQWLDQSGYGNHANSPSPSLSPIYIEDSQNGFPAVSFNFNKLEIPSSPSIQVANLDIFAVVKRNEMSDFGTVLSRRFYASGPWQEPYVSYSMQASERFNPPNIATPRPYAQVAVTTATPPYFQRLCNGNPPHDPVPDGSAYIHQLVYDGNQMESWLNNSSWSIIPGAGSIHYNGNNLPLVIGQGGASSSHELKGNISEIVFFGSNISIVDQVIVLNYLASKYDIDISYDKYNEQADFVHDIIGIGREPDNSHLSSNGGALSISASGFPNPAAYIFAGHNNAPMRGTPVNLPAQHQSRMQRVWFIDVTGVPPATTTLTFTLPYNPSTNKNYYSLLYSSSPDFSNPTMVVTASLVNIPQKTVHFNVPAASMVDGYFTLGSMVNHWNGSLDDAWTNADNWDGGVPTELSDVMITGNCNNYPVMTSNSSHRYFYMEAGSNINQNGFDISLTRNFLLTGGNFQANGGDLIFTGNLSSDIYAPSAQLGDVRVEKTGSGFLYSAYPLNIRGDFEIVSGSIQASSNWQIGGNLIFHEGTTYQLIGINIVMNGNSNQNIMGEFTGNLLSIENVNPASVIDITQAEPFMLNTFRINSGHVITAGQTLWNVEINPGGSLELADNLVVTRNWTNAGTFYPAQFKVSFTQNLVQQVISGGYGFYDIEINKNGGSVNITDDMIIDHDFNITQGTINAGSNNITVGGNWDNTGIFDAGTSTLVFNGVQSQTISGNGTTFNNLVIDNQAGVDINTIPATVNSVSNNLTITTNSVLNIMSGSHLTVQGTIENQNVDGGMVIKSGVNGMGSLIHNESDLEAKVEMDLLGGQWQNIVIPTTEARAGAFMDIYMRYWDEPATNWFWIEGTGSEDTLLIAGRGYGVWPEADTNVVISGTLNYAESFNLPVSGQFENPAGMQNWNFIGNPYCCALDLTLGDLEKTNMSESVYVWDGELGNYLVYNDNINEGTIENGIIPALQGFWMKALEPAPVLNVPDQLRVHSGIPIYKSMNQGNANCLRVSVKDQYGKGDRMVLLENTMASPIFNESEDSRKLAGTSDSPSIYSVAGGEYLTLNSFPVEDPTVTIPVHFKCGTAGSHLLEFDGMDSFSNSDVFLKDKQTGLTYSLKEQPVISITANLQDDEARFEIEFEKTNGMYNTNAPENFNLYYHNGLIYFNSTDFYNCHIKIFSIHGSQVFDAVNGHSENSWPVYLPTGIYLCRVTANNKVFSQKMFVK